MDIKTGDKVIYRNETHKVIRVSDNGRMIDLECLRTGEVIICVFISDLTN